MLEHVLDGHPNISCNQAQERGVDVPAGVEWNRRATAILVSELFV